MYHPVADVHIRKIYCVSCLYCVGSAVLCWCCLFRIYVVIMFEHT